MTAEQRKLCRDLVITPPRGVSQISKDEFLRQAPTLVEHGKLALKPLEEAYRAQNADDLQCALIIGHTFGFGPEHREILCSLVDVDWHHSHEDVVAALDGLRSPEAVEALFHATQWIPKSLEHDDSRALAVKAIWALGKIPGTEAEAKLETLAHSDNAILKRTVAEQLERRHKAT
jgi:hypothetical protein